MTLALLDHPWPLESALNGASVLKRFNDWIREHPWIEPVRFIPLSEYEATLQGMSDHHARTSGGAFLRRFAYDYVRYESGGALASPVPEVEGIRDSWRQALHEAMHDPKDWRTPQIIAATERRNAWPNTDEIDIRDQPEKRVLAILEEYDRHPFAISDFDPWDLQRCHNREANRLSVFRCHLPKHPCLENISLAELGDHLLSLREKGWQYDVKGETRYFYIPPANWDFTSISAHDWRHDCKTFPRGSAAGGRGSGPIDQWGRVWVWDRQKHTHWDVQFPTKEREDNPKYCVVSDTGELIRDPDGVCSPTSQRR